MKSDIYRELVKIVGSDNVLMDEPMSRHTTFRIGGPADYFVLPRSARELSECLHLLKKAGGEFFVLGNGSNLLVSDQGYRGCILCTKNITNLSCRSGKITAGAGAPLTQLAVFAKKNGLAGLEFAYGIPGTLGGALVMNAGAYGGEMKDLVKSVTVLLENGNERTLTGEQMEFGYRSSILMDRDWTAVSAVLELQNGNPEEISERMDGNLRARQDKQPLEYPSAGSTFKRPEGFFAGKLIMDCGLAGFCVGDAEVSTKHCGFLINKGHASCREMLELMHKVQETVEGKYHVHLEPEVRFLGC
ncbi:MAG: UDP-N-acetylmuramate dehydrogenase [Eubacterium sp.]|nr:UDP-N-acetylmuramate dehydrogenase [Eubacterium sp.]